MVAQHKFIVRIAVRSCTGVPILNFKDGVESNLFVTLHALGQLHQSPSVAAAREVVFNHEFQLDLESSIPAEWKEPDIVAFLKDEEFVLEITQSFTLNLTQCCVLGAYRGTFWDLLFSGDTLASCKRGVNMDLEMPVQHLLEYHVEPPVLSVTVFCIPDGEEVTSFKTKTVRQFETSYLGTNTFKFYVSPLQGNSSAESRAKSPASRYDQVSEDTAREDKPVNKEELHIEDPSFAVDTSFLDANVDEVSEEESIHDSMHVFPPTARTSHEFRRTTSQTSSSKFASNAADDKPISNPSTAASSPKRVKVQEESDRRDWSPKPAVHRQCEACNPVAQVPHKIPFHTPPPLRIPFLITDQRCWCTKCINCDDCECGAYHTPSAKKSSGGKRAPSGVNTGGVSTHHQHKGEQQAKRGKSPVKARQQHESEQPTTAHATPSPEQAVNKAEYLQNRIQSLMGLLEKAAQPIQLKGDFSPAANSSKLDISNTSFNISTLDANSSLYHNSRITANHHNNSFISNYNTNEDSNTSKVSKGPEYCHGFCECEPLPRQQFEQLLNDATKMHLGVPKQTLVVDNRGGAHKHQEMRFSASASSSLYHRCPFCSIRKPYGVR